MPSALLNIGLSGAKAARAALEVSAQNVANASNADYSRRTVSQSEVVATANIGGDVAESPAGVRIGAIARIDADTLRLQVRDSISDLARTDAELVGLRGAESALEQSRLFESLTDFEASLVRLESDPLDPALRASAFESAGKLAATFRLAEDALAGARQTVRLSVEAGIDEANGAAERLALINRDLAGSETGSMARAALLDARDAALEDLATQFSLSTSFEPNGVVQVRLGDASGPLMVDRASVSLAEASFAADGSIGFAVGGESFAPQGGAMGGYAAAAIGQTAAKSDLDEMAALLIERFNTAQSSGTTPDGTNGQPLFSGTSASDIAVSLPSGDGFALAPAGSLAGSRASGNLAALITAIGGTDGPIARADQSLLSLSSAVSGLNIRRESLALVAQSAEVSLSNRTGVDLDAEAANLVRLQQAFEANGRVMQVATELFDTILSLR